MKKWKAISVAMRSWAVANLITLAGVFLLPFSRSSALKVFFVFKVSAAILLVLLPVEYALGRMQGAKASAVLINAMLVLLMFTSWFIIAAATF